LEAPKLEGFHRIEVAAGGMRSLLELGKDRDYRDTVEPVADEKEGMLELELEPHEDVIEHTIEGELAEHPEEED
jgi:hypothetical protein